MFPFLEGTLPVSPSAARPDRLDPRGAWAGVRVCKRVVCACGAVQSLSRIPWPIARNAVIMFRAASKHWPANHAMDRRK